MFSFLDKKQDGRACISKKNGHACILVVVQTLIITQN